MAEDSGIEGRIVRKTPKLRYTRKTKFDHAWNDNTAVLKAAIDRMTRRVGDEVFAEFAEQFLESELQDEVLTLETVSTRELFTILARRSRRYAIQAGATDEELDQG